MFHKNKNRGLSEKQNIISFFKKVELLKEFTDAEILALYAITHKRRYSKKELLFLSEDASQTFYIILEGEIKGYIEIQGEITNIFTKQKYDTTGKGAIIKQNKRLYTTVCVSDYCIVYAIPMISLEKLWQVHPIIRIKIMESLATSYYLRVEKIVEVYKKELGFFDLKDIFVK